MRTSPSSYVLAGLLLFNVGAAHADDVYCQPHLGAERIDGDVIIVAPCTLTNTVVKGDVLLYTGGSLIARGAVIDGNVQARVADFVDIADSRIDGDIKLEDLVGDLIRVESSSIKGKIQLFRNLDHMDADRIEIRNNRVDGNIQLERNRSRHEVLDNNVDGDVRAFENLGALVIADNDIDGNLRCRNNSPAPAGGNNRVGGNKEDQCADLTPEVVVGTSTVPAPAAPAAPAAPGAPVAQNVPSAVALSDDPASEDTGGGGGAVDLLSLLGLSALLLFGGFRRRVA